MGKWLVSTGWHGHHSNTNTTNMSAGFLLKADPSLKLGMHGSVSSMQTVDDAAQAKSGKFLFLSPRIEPKAIKPKKSRFGVMENRACLNFELNMVFILIIFHESKKVLLLRGGKGGGSEKEYS